MNLGTQKDLEANILKFKNRCVKDLYWLLFSKCPINNHHPLLKDLPFFPKDVIEAWRLNSANYFIQLDQNPDELSQFLNRPKNKRLGFYAEALLSFFFQTFPDIELLFQNHQVIEQKRTIGEVDFIIKWNDRIIHLECAVKFYLYDQSKDVNDLHSWIGPACKDDLGRKMNKILQHQLPMINSLKKEEILKSHKVESYLFLRGKLFVNRHTRCNWIEAEALGKYRYLNELIDTSDYCLIPKPYWLATQIEKSFKDAGESINSESLKRRAEMVLKNGEGLLFVTPKGWPF